MIGYACILQNERHDLITEGAPLCDKSGFLHVFGRHFDLVVPGEAIHEGEYFILSSVVNQNINMWKWKVILGACPIKIIVVHTHPYLGVLFMHQNHVGNPLGIRGDS